MKGGSTVLARMPERVGVRNTDPRRRSEKARAETAGRRPLVVLCGGDRGDAMDSIEQHNMLSGRQDAPAPIAPWNLPVAQYHDRRESALRLLRVDRRADGWPRRFRSRRKSHRHRHFVRLIGRAHRAHDRHQHGIRRAVRFAGRCREFWHRPGHCRLCLGLPQPGRRQRRHVPRPFRLAVLSRVSNFLRMAAGALQREGHGAWRQQELCRHADARRRGCCGRDRPRLPLARPHRRPALGLRVVRASARRLAP